jgi:hypothetical protein
MKNPESNLVLQLRAALEAGWDAQTSYQGVSQPGNPAYGQCYPTANVVQHYFPEYEIVKGKVWTGTTEETHFWNARLVDNQWHHLDLSWQQFPNDSVVKTFEVLKRERSWIARRPSIVALCCCSALRN